MQRTAEEFSFRTNTSDTITDPSIHISGAESGDSYFLDDANEELEDVGYDEGADGDMGREEEHEMQSKEGPGGDELDRSPRWTADIHTPNPVRYSV